MEAAKELIPVILKLNSLDPSVLARNTERSLATIRKGLWQIAEFQQVQDPPKIAKSGRHIYADTPGDIIVMDTLETLDRHRGKPNKAYYICAMDVYSRYVVVYGCDVLNSENAIVPLKSLIELGGTGFRARKVFSDDGKEFKKDFMKYCKDNDIKLHKFNASAGHGRGVSHMNAFHKYLRNRLRDAIQVLGKRSYHAAIETIVAEYNERVHSATKAKPIELLYGEAESHEKRRKANMDYPLGIKVRRRLKPDKQPKKSMRVHWSPEVYTLEAVFNGQYFARGEDDTVVSGSQRHFLPIPDDTISLEDYREKFQPKRTPAFIQEPTRGQRAELRALAETAGPAPERPRGRRRALRGNGIMNLY